MKKGKRQLLKRWFSVLAVLALLVTQQPIIMAVESGLPLPDTEANSAFVGRGPSGEIVAIDDEIEEEPSVTDEQADAEEPQTEGDTSAEADSPTEEEVLEGEGEENYPETETEGEPETETEPYPETEIEPENGDCEGLFCVCEYCDGSCRPTCHISPCVNSWCDNPECPGVGEDGFWAPCTRSYCRGEGCDTPRRGTYCSQLCCCVDCDETGATRDCLDNRCPNGLISDGQGGYRINFEDPCTEYNCDLCFGHTCCGTGAVPAPCRCGPHCRCDGGDCGCDDDGPCPCEEPTIEKVAIGNPAVGNSITYRLTVGNMSTEALTELTVRDSLPVGLDRPSEIVIGGVTVPIEIGENVFEHEDSDGNTYWEVVLDIANVPALSSVVIFITTEVLEEAAGETLENRAYLYRGGEQLDYDDADVDVPELEAPSIEKVASTDEIQLGDSFYYTITVTNNDRTTLTNVVVTDVLPEGLDLSEFVYSMVNVSGILASDFSVTFSGRTVTVTIHSLPANQNVIINIPVTVSEDASLFADTEVGGETVAGNILTNNATLSAPDRPDQEADADVTVILPGDPTITKTASQTVTQEGMPLQYTITVSNSQSHLTAEDVVVVDQLPQGMAPPTHIYVGDVRVDVGGVAPTTPRFVIEGTAPNQSIRIFLGDIAGDSDVMIFFTGIVPAQAAPAPPEEGEEAPPVTITNTVRLYVEEDRLVDTDTEETVVEETEGPTIEKRADSQRVLAGERVWYTITVANPSHLTLEDILITDNIPSRLALVPGTVSVMHNDTIVANNRPDPYTVTTAGATLEVSGQNISLRMDELGADDIVTIRFQVQTTVDDVGPHTNTANLWVGDDHRGYDTETITIPVIEEPEIIKTVQPANANVGDYVNFTITVNNLSHLPAENLRVVDFLPPHLTLAGAITPLAIVGTYGPITQDDIVLGAPSPQMGQIRNPYGSDPETILGETGGYYQTLTINNISIAPGRSVIISIPMRVNASAVNNRNGGTEGAHTQQTNYVYLYQVNDDNTTSEIADDYATVTVNVPPNPVITKSVLPSTVLVGESFNFTIRVESRSHVPTDYLWVQDLLPVGMPAPAPANVMINGVAGTAANVIIESVFYETITDEDGVETDVYRYQFTVGPLNPLAGSTASHTITFSVIATEDMAGLDDVNEVILFDRDSPVDGYHPRELGRDETPVHVPELNPPTIDKDLATAGQLHELGQVVQFTITVRNNSHLPMVGHRVYDVLLPGLQFVGSSIVPVVNELTAPYYGDGESRIGWNVPTLNEGGLFTFTVTARIVGDLSLHDTDDDDDNGYDNGYENGEYDNGYDNGYENGDDNDEPTDERSGLWNDVFLYGAADADGNRELKDECSEPVPMAPIDPPRIEKTVDRSSARVGDRLTYTITVTNPMNVRINNVQILDAIPNHLIVADPVVVTWSHSGNPHLDAIINPLSLTIQPPRYFDVGGVQTSLRYFVTPVFLHMEPNSTMTFTFTATIANEAAGTTLNNGVALFIDGTQRGRDNAITEVAPIPPPVITKTASVPVAMPNQLIVYTIAVTNPSHLPIDELWVVDALPPGLTFVRALGGTPAPTGPAGTSFSYTSEFDHLDGRQTLTFHLAGTPATAEPPAPAVPALGPNETVLLRFEVRVTNPDLVEDLGNGVEGFDNWAFLFEEDPTTEGSSSVDRDNAIVTTPDTEDPQIFKTVSTPTAILGQIVEYTITVTNPTNQNITGATVRDFMPRGMIADPTTLQVDGETWPAADLTWDAAAGTNPPTIPAERSQVLEIRNITIPANGSVMIRFMAEVDPAAEFHFIDENRTLINTARLIITGDPDRDATATVVVPPLTQPVLEKEASPSVVLVGDRIFYSLTISNDSHLDRVNVPVVDGMPTGLVWDEISTETLHMVANGATWGDPRYTRDGNEFTFMLATLPANSSATILFSVLVTEDAVGNVTNTARTWERDDQATVFIPELEPPTIVKTGNLTEAFVDDDILYTITVTNPSHLIARNLIVEDRLPEGLALDLTSITLNGEPLTQGTTLADGVFTFDAATGTLRVFMEELGPHGQTAIINLTATVLESARLDAEQIPNELVNTARLYVRGDEGDEELIDDDYHEVIVDPVPAPTIEKQVRRQGEAATENRELARVPIGQVVTYTITVTNQSDRYALEDVTVRDILPPHIEVLTDSVRLGDALLTEGAGGFTLVGNVLTVYVPFDILPSTSVTISFDAEVLVAAEDQVLVNEAYIYVDDERQNLTDDCENTATVEATPLPILTKQVRIAGEAVTENRDHAVAVIGQTVIYTILVTNPSTQEEGFALDEVWVVDELPPHLDVDRASFTVDGVPHTASFNAAGDEFTIGPFAIAAGATVTITFEAEVLVEAALEDYLINWAFVYITDPADDDSEDRDDAVDRDYATVEAVIRPTIEKLVNGQDSVLVAANTTVTYTITVRNPSGAELFDLWVVDDLPILLRLDTDSLALDGIELEQFASTDELEANVGFVLDGRRLIVRIPSVPANGEVVISFEAEVLAIAGEEVDNVAYLYIGNPDTPGNESVDDDDANVRVPAPGGGGGGGMFIPPLRPGEPDDDDDDDDDYEEEPGDDEDDEEPGDDEDDDDRDPDDGDEPGDDDRDPDDGDDDQSGDGNDTPGNQPGTGDGDDDHTIPQTGDEFTRNALVVSALGLLLSLFAFLKLFNKKKGAHEA